MNIKKYEDKKFLITIIVIVIISNNVAAKKGNFSEKELKTFHFIPKSLMGF